MMYFLMFGMGVVTGIALVIFALVLANASMNALKDFDE
jgi:hypothetical protein